MFWLLVVMLWPAQGKPQGIVSPVFPTEQACKDGALRLGSDIAADQPQTIAAVTAKCVMFSNPLTELKP